jgi:phage internal scaffolding protein
MHSFYSPNRRRVTRDNEYRDPHTGEITTMPSMTKQEFQHECDINNVIKSFTATGMFKHVSAAASSGAYQDLPDAYDFQEALHQVQQAREAFMTLPAKLRSRFGNDPTEFLAFTHDPANKDELRTLGLLKPTPLPPAPVIVKIEPQTPSGGAGGTPPAGGAPAP